MKNKLPLIAASAFLSLALFATPAFAQKPTTSMRPKPTLIPARMQSCETRSEAIQKRLAQLLKMTTNMLEVFDNHAQRIQDYYTNTLVPSGKTVENYSTLVSAISTKRAAVTAAWDEASTNANDFSCTNGDPRTLLNQFRIDMQATKRALGEYRTAIKNLLVAVRRVSPTPAPSPTVSPSPSPSTN